MQRNIKSNAAQVHLLLTTASFKFAKSSWIDFCEISCRAWSNWEMFWLNFLCAAPRVQRKQKNWLTCMEGKSLHASPFMITKLFPLNKTSHFCLTWLFSSAQWGSRNYCTDSWRCNSFFPKAESQNKAEESISQKYLLLHADCKDSSSWPSQMNKPTLEMYEGR